MKNHHLLTLIGGCLLLIIFNFSITGCGQKGDLIRPGSDESQQSSAEDSESDEQKQSTP
jgi:predicted small lipoprotein YifL